MQEIMFAKRKTQTLLKLKKENWINIIWKINISQIFNHQKIEFANKFFWSKKFISFFFLQSINRKITRLQTETDRKTICSDISYAKFMSYSWMYIKEKKITFYVWDCKMFIELYILRRIDRVTIRMDIKPEERTETHAYDALFKNTIILSNWW